MWLVSQWVFYWESFWCNYQSIWWEIRSFWIFSLNDMLLNEILKNPKQFKTFEIIKWKSNQLYILRKWNCWNLIHWCFETTAGSGKKSKKGMEFLFFLTGESNVSIFWIQIVFEFFKMIRWTEQNKYVINISSVVCRFEFIRTFIKLNLFMKAEKCICQSRT